MPSRVKAYTSSEGSLSESLFFLPEKTMVMSAQTKAAIRSSMPRILKNISNLFQLIRRSNPTIRITTARNITGIAALDAANLLITLANPDSSRAGVVLLLDEAVFLPELERVPEREEVFLEPPLEELEERDLPVFAIIS